MGTMSRFRAELKVACLPVEATELLQGRGVSEYSLRGRGWRQTSRGWYVPSSVDRDSSPTQRIVESIPLIPAEGALAGWAAAFVHGVDQLDGRDPWTFAPQPVPIVRGADRGHIPRDWLVSYRDRLQNGDVVVVQGLPVTSPLRTAFDGSRRAGSLAEAVAFIDAMAHTERIAIAELASYIVDHPGWRGISLARRACALAHPGALSTWESRQRLFHVVEAELPTPLVNQPIFDLSGGLLGIADLFDPDAGLVHEFDGQFHRERTQHRRDNVREESFESTGLIVVRSDSLDLRDHRLELARRLRDGWQRGMARDRSHDRWTLIEPAWFVAQRRRRR
jgi:hypothetical protein